MAKVLFNNKIEKDVKDLFDSLYDKIGGHKFRIIESAIEVFAVLPKEYQLTMISQDNEEREKVLSLIRKLDGIGSRKKHA